jgi:Protein of unknown function (DUF2891)
VNLAGKWGERLRAEATGYAQVALANIKREFPSAVYHTMTKPGDFPFRPRARTPVFYGSYDWHSCVEMHWLLVRLLRVAAGAVPAREIKTALNAHFSRVPMEAEAEFIGGPDGLGQRPYGWGWALALIEETRALGGPDGQKWAAAMEPLAEAVNGAFLQWLPQASYPVRYGVHSNTAFGLSRALPSARRQEAAGQPALAEVITAKAYQWYAADTLYPGAFEPSGHDFLSPALCEAELLAQVMPADEFSSWLSFFLPGVAGGEPASLFKPVDVTDPTDGQIAHLHGLNASRAWCWRRIAESLPAGDDRIAPAALAAELHANAVLPHVVGDDYMVEHWLPSYAVLMLS